MEIKIDKNVPLPYQRTRYPFNEMNVGDSFLFPAAKRNSVASVSSRVTEKKFCVRRIDDHYARCWRVA